MRRPKEWLVAVIPAFRASKTIEQVVEDAIKYFDQIIVVDDGCPEGTGQIITNRFTKSERVSVFTNTKNLGVGGAAKVGLTAKPKMSPAIFVKIDADGQMDLRHLERLIEPIRQQTADLTKGNRFSSREDLAGMPSLRLFGNSLLTLMNRISTGLWRISDPTNGFFAISSTAIEKIPWNKVADSYLFETELLFRAAMTNLRVRDISMPAIYKGETSSLKPIKLIAPLFHAHLKQYFKRIAIQYVVREMNPGTLYLVGGLGLFVFGLLFGAITWIQSSSLGQFASAGTVSIATVSMILGFQLLLQFSAYDISKSEMELKEPLQ